MAQVETLITGGKVVSSSGVQEMDVGIKDGKIYSLTTPGSGIEAAKSIDAHGKHILPGCVDVHVHTRDPGQTHKEGFATLTQAAARGGVTTIMCQPTTTPPINSVETFMAVVEDWPSKAVVDFAIQGMAEPDNLGEIKGMMDAGSISMEFLGVGSNGPLMMDIMKVVHENGGLSGISVGDGGHSQFMRQRLQEGGQKDIHAWLSAWPNRNEAVATARLLLLTEDTPYRFHFHMITTRKAIQLIREAKETRADQFTVETSPKYLLLTEEDHVRLGAFGTVLPRFKTADDNEAVWEAVLDGSIDMVATDHAPHSREEKQTGLEDIWKAPTGVPEVELSLPLMLTQVNKGKLSLPQLVGLMAETPAKEYGIHPQKGAVQVGSDADVVIVDMDQERVVDDAKLETAPKYSAFGGFALKGLPVMTMVRGQVVMEGSKAVQSTPHGNMVRPRR